MSYNYPNSNFQNMNSNSNNISTSFTTLSSETSVLKVGGFNQNISLRISPTTGVNMNGVREYSKDRFGQTALSPANAKVLFKKYNAEIRPLIEKYETDGIFPGSQSVAVEAGKDNQNLISIEFDLDENNKPAMFLGIYQNVAENGVASQMSSFKHKFRTTPYLRSYNPATGESIKSEDPYADFDNFLDIIEKPSNILPLGYHGQKYVTEWSERFKKNTPNNNGGGFTGGGFSSGGFGNRGGDELPFAGSESGGFFG